MSYSTAVPDVATIKSGRFRRFEEPESSPAWRTQVFSRFAAGVAERINTPLAVVSGWLQLLGSDNAADSALADKLRLMKEEADRIADMTRQLLAFAVQAPPENDRVEIAGLLAELVRLSSGRVSGKGIRVTAALSQDLPEILGDEGQLRRALDAVLQHSEAALRGGCTLQITVRRAGRGVEVVFQDDGPPIPPERLKALFDPFAPTRIPSHDGLSLAIAHAMIQNHGGSVAASSDASPCTRFIIWLPCRK